MTKPSTIYDHVKSILERCLRARESDLRLSWEMLIDYDFNPSTLTVQRFFTILKSKKFPSLESIGRARRKVQEQHQELRGYNYAARQTQEKVIKADVNGQTDMFN